MSSCAHHHLVSLSLSSTTDFDGIENAGSTFKHLLADNLPIDGPMPSEILMVPSLKLVSMASCGLNGALPAGIQELERLEELYLYNNELRGALPGSSLGSLSRLRVLSLAENQLSGLVPPELVDLDNLRALSLTDQVSKGGGFNGQLPSFENSQSLNMIMLGNNLLDGPIPSNLMERMDTSTTVTVDLSNNRLTGTVPGDLSRFTSMNIYLEGNELNGIADDLCFMGQWNGGLVAEYKCDAILCPSNSSGGRQVFDDVQCQTCPTATSISSSWLGQEQCGEQDPSLTERAILERFYHQCGGIDWHNQKNWMSEESVCTWYGITCDESKEVKDITLENNQVIGFIPTEIYELPKLEKLSLYSNIVNIFFDGIENAENLHTLKLDSTTLASLDGVEMARSLRDLSVSSNQLQGPVPVALKSLVHLESLSISDNSFTGEIPFWVSELPSLEKFLAANNQFGGPLYDFADMETLTYVDLSGNQLGGGIPATLLQSADPEEKIVVDLSGNSLAGTVPSELSRLPLLSLHLANNQITDIGDGLCKQKEWNDHDVEDYGCDGLLCPIGFSNLSGRQTSDDHPCVPCEEAQFMGSTVCHSTSGSRAILRPAALSIAIATYVAMGVYFLM